MDRRTPFTDRFQETIIAILLGGMTLLTFANVIARYVFNSNIFFALELTVFLFAWLVLLGTSYAVKKTQHLGVDAVVNLAKPKLRRIMGLVSAAACILYAFFLLKGAWDYWAPFGNLPPTEGRWFPEGFVEKYRGRGWYETLDIPVPFFMEWLADVFNDGEPYEKLPKLVPYLVLPVSMALLLYQFCKISVSLWKGQVEMLIVSHEAEDEVEAAALKLKETEKDS
jgi:C4-dicarboxylate transporter, DctQ subunit